MEYASFGSISSGTMRTEHLLDTFASELEYLNERNQDGPLYGTNLALLAAVGATEDYDSEEASELVQELADALNEFAPPYAYFGAHPGDGADYGYWLHEDMQSDFDGLQVDDTSEVPADYSGEVLHVNDHGNMTLYAADKGQLREVWAIV